MSKKTTFDKNNSEAQVDLSIFDDQKPTKARSERGSVIQFDVSDRYPAHSANYYAYMDAYNQMLAENDAETLAVFELLRRVCRANNARLTGREFPQGYVSMYTFYSLVLLCPLHIRFQKDALVDVKIGDSAWFTFSADSLAYARAIKLTTRADEILLQRQHTEIAKCEAMEATKRAQQRQNLLNLLADVRTRQKR